MSLHLRMTTKKEKCPHNCYFTVMIIKGYSNRRKKETLLWIRPRIILMITKFSKIYLIIWTKWILPLTQGIEPRQHYLRNSNNKYHLQTIEESSLPYPQIIIKTYTKTKTITILTFSGQKKRWMHGLINDSKLIDIQNDIKLKITHVQLSQLWSTDIY